jgi:hypothetical protein
MVTRVNGLRVLWLRQFQRSAVVYLFFVFVQAWFVDFVSVANQEAKRESSQRANLLEREGYRCRSDGLGSFVRGDHRQWLPQK